MLIRSSYVCRVRDNSRFDVIETRPLSNEAIAAGLLSDEVVELGAGTNPKSKSLTHAVRLIQIRTTPSPPRGKSPGGTTGPPSDGVLRIAPLTSSTCRPRSFLKSTGLGPLSSSSDGPLYAARQAVLIHPASHFRHPTSAINHPRSDTMCSEQSLSRTSVTTSLKHRDGPTILKLVRRSGIEANHKFKPAAPGFAGVLDDVNW
jgi:hypothetical protein